MQNTPRSIFDLATISGPPYRYEEGCHAEVSPITPEGQDPVYQGTEGWSQGKRYMGFKTEQEAVDHLLRMQRSRQRGQQSFW